MDNIYSGEQQIRTGQLQMEIIACGTHFCCGKNLDNSTYLLVVIRSKACWILRKEAVYLYRNM